MREKYLGNKISKRQRRGKDEREVRKKERNERRSAPSSLRCRGGSKEIEMRSRHFVTSLTIPFRFSHSPFTPFLLKARFPLNVIFRASDRPDFVFVSCFALRRFPRGLEFTCQVSQRIRTSSTKKTILCKVFFPFIPFYLYVKNVIQERERGRVVLKQLKQSFILF